jgi:DNA recombination protein RmuC
MDPTSSFVTVVMVALLTGVVTWFFFRTKIDGMNAQIVARDGELVQARNSLMQATDTNTELQTQLLAARTEQAGLAERLKAERESFERERTSFETSKASLVETFRSVGAEVLDNNSAKLAELAKGVIARENADAKGSMDLKEQAIADIVGPVREQLEKLHAAVGEIERKREGAYGDVTTKLESLIRTESELQRETTNLSVNTATLMQALKGSGTRGRWGEFTLQRVVEMAGMTEHCEYDVQPTLSDEESSSRPDMIVHLPGDGFVVIDAKVPMEAYIAGMEAGDEVTRNLKGKEHARSVRAHVDALANRSYVRPGLGSPDFVIMFVPGEGILSSAFNEDPDLLEYAYARKIIFATPTNLIAMLRTIALSWQHRALEADAAEIAREGGELYERLAKCGKYVAEMGTNLNRTVASYNEMVGNLEGRVMISGRRLRDRAISLKRGDEIPEAEPIETTARPLSAPEFLSLESGEGAETRALTGSLGDSNGSHRHGTNGSTNGSSNGASKNGSNGSSNGSAARANGHARTNGPANLAVSTLLNVLGLLRK